MPDFSWYNQPKWEKYIKMAQNTRNGNKKPNWHELTKFVHTMAFKSLP
jgi:hypothetical protein